MENGNPCFGCTMRTPTCHREGECTNTPTYAEWKKEHERKLEEKREAKHKEDMVDDYFIEQAIKRRKTVARLKKMDFYEGGKKR